MPRETLSDSQQRAIDWIQRGSAKELGALGTEIGKMLAEMVAELADAKREAMHWHAAFETVRDEIKVMASTIIQKQGGGRLAIRREDFAKAVGQELFCDNESDPNVRVYELRAKTEATPIDDAVRRIVRSH